MTTANVIYLAFTVLAFTIGVAVLRANWRLHYTNLYLLALLYFLSGVQLLGSQVLFGNDPLAFRLITIVVGTTNILFVKNTFHQGTRSAFIPVLVLFHVLVGSSIVFVLLGAVPGAPDIALLPRATLSAANATQWGWHLVSAAKGYTVIAPSTRLNDWIKVRYKLVIAYASTQVGSAFIMLFIESGATITLFVLLLLSLTTCSMVTSFIAWVMPNWLKRYFDRAFVRPADLSVAIEHMSDEDLEKMIEGGIAA